ncbi:hypothetical protein OOT33_12045 [Sphingobium sp. DEHP117]|uniref:hypothetical protein n=1 Tax=Sphingobium sp. DEHP117 TaxID=2993436 RepID=UPI0027D6E5ED|nr:hypothetical protein [Sphingobium sp. DEHP117]MDQ4421159.1 hypothetical protein [Sphingobium sp. DEHP117]
MSQDQKPKPVRAVTMAGSGAPADGSEGGAVATDDVGDDAAEQGAADHAPRRASTFPLIPALLFLIGCALGGAALTALPHQMPELAASLYGNRP